MNTPCSDSPGCLHASLGAIASQPLKLSRNREIRIGQPLPDFARVTHALKE